MNPYEFDRKMNNIFKDTIPKGGIQEEDFK